MHLLVREMEEAIYLRLGHRPVREEPVPCTPRALSPLRSRAGTAVNIARQEHQILNRGDARLDDAYEPPSQALQHRCCMLGPGTRDAQNLRSTYPAASVRVSPKFVHQLSAGIRIVRAERVARDVESRAAHAPA